MRTIAKLCPVLWMACCSALAAPAQNPAASDPPGLVRTVYGPVQGVAVHDGDVLRWLGIPYAAPPLGEHRWQAPQPPAPWTQTFAATAYGHACSQIGSSIGPPAEGKPWGPDNIETFGKPVGSEDCLSLNVWRPAGAGHELPVLVFIPGGGGILGYSADPIYDGANLAARAGIVVVTVNYRLGLFGSFLHPALTAPDAASRSGNFATLDLIQALRFVHDNATAFGGDARNVTVMGQSAGGTAIYRLLGSKLADDLFQKAIVLSGIIPGTHTREQGWAFSEALAARLVVQDGLAKDPQAAAALIAAKGPEWIRGYLVAKPASELLEAMLKYYHELPDGPGTFGDGYVLPPDLSAAYDTGSFHRVPMIVGTTRDEAKLLMPLNRLDDRQLFSLMRRSAAPGVSQPRLDEIVKPWLLPSLGAWPYDTVMSLLTRWLAGMADGALAKVAKYQPQVYAYRFEWNRGPEPWRTLYGASHGSDLPFVFGNFGDNLFSMDYTAQNQPGREALSAQMMRAVAAFVHSGDPNGDGLPGKWARWSAGDGTGQKRVFDATDSGVCSGRCD